MYVVIVSLAFYAATVTVRVVSIIFFFLFYVGNKLKENIDK